MLEFLEEIRAEIHKLYPDEDTGYINLALEPNLEDHFTKARVALGGRPRPGPAIKGLRRKARRVYRARL